MVLKQKGKSLDCIRNNYDGQKARLFGMTYCDASIHSEISALIALERKMSKSSYSIKDIRRKMKKITLYVIRVNEINQLRNSAPCAHCLYWIQKLGIKRIVYSIDENTYVSSNPNHLTTTHLSNSQRKIMKNRSF